MAALRRSNKSKKVRKKEATTALHLRSGGGCSIADSSDIQTAGLFFFFLKSSSFAVFFAVCVVIRQKKTVRRMSRRGPRARRKGLRQKKLDGPHSKTDYCSPTRFRQCCDSRWPPTGRMGLLVKVGGTYLKSWRHRKKKLLSAFIYLFILFLYSFAP